MLSNVYRGGERVAPDITIKNKIYHIGDGDRGIVSCASTISLTGIQRRKLWQTTGYGKR